MEKLIIVLAHPRTGSSMLMQSLRLLRVEIMGLFEREDLPEEANPKGYYEDRKILSKGLTDEAIEKIEKREKGPLAVKIALAGMVREDRMNQWRYLLARRAIILVPIRPPLETALSKMVFNPSHDRITRFKSITSFLRNYQLQFKAISKILVDEIPEILPHVHTVQHGCAYENPERYVQRIINTAGLSVSQGQLIDAVNNIDPALYRYDQEFFEKELWEWHRKIGAEVFYQVLSTREDPWQAIHEMSLYRQQGA